MEKNYSLEMLEGKIPSSIYALLMSDDPMSLPDCSDEDWSKAINYLCPPIPKGWQVVKQRAFTEEELNAVGVGVICPTKFGLGIKFYTHGNPVLLPCSADADFKEGQRWYAKDLSLLELSKYGEEFTIFRVVPAGYKAKIAVFPDIPCDELRFRNDVYSKLCPIKRAQYKRQGKKFNPFENLKLY